jgi:hypothetical protein
MAAKIVTIYTDSQTSLDPIKNARIHTSLIDNSTTNQEAGTS